MASTAEIQALKRELNKLEAEQEKLENELQDTRQIRKRLKLRKKRGAVITDVRIAAYTQKVGRLQKRLKDVNNGITWRERVIRRGSVGGKSAQGMSQEILQLNDAGHISFPLPLSTGGTARRDFVQLSSNGKVRIPATGRWITPSGPQLNTIRTVRDAGRRAKAGAGVAVVTAVAGGIHRGGSLHYDLRAIDNREGDSIVNTAARQNDGNFFDENNTHDHNWFGTGGP